MSPDLIHYDLATFMQELLTIQPNLDAKISQDNRQLQNGTDTESDEDFLSSKSKIWFLRVTYNSSE